MAKLPTSAVASGQLKKISQTTEEKMIVTQYSVGNDT
jgi:hypothetical protein